MPLKNSDVLFYTHPLPAKLNPLGHLVLYNCINMLYNSNQFGLKTPEHDFA
jgi:hypothetical protein